MVTQRFQEQTIRALSYEFGVSSPYATNTHRAILLNNAASITDTSTPTQVLAKELLNSEGYARVAFTPASPAWDGANSRAQFSEASVTVTFTTGANVLTFDAGVIIANTQTTANKTVSAIASDILTATAHGLSNDDKVFFKSDGTLPTGITDELTYFVRNQATNTFQIATTAGGSPISVGGSWTGTLTVYYLKNTALVCYDELPAAVTLNPSQTYTYVFNLTAKNPTS